MKSYDIFADATYREMLKVSGAVVKGETIQKRVAEKAAREQTE